MTLPVSVPTVPEWQLCRVRWEISDYTGTPVSATVAFSSPVATVAGARKTLVRRFPTATIIDGVLHGVDGNPWVDLVASMDTDVTPNAWTITATATATTGEKVSATFTTPVGGDINLNSYLAFPAPESPGTLVTRGRGIAGDITAVNTTATVTYTDGTTSTYQLPAGPTAVFDADAVPYLQATPPAPTGPGVQPGSKRLVTEAAAGGTYQTKIGILNVKDPAFGAKGDGATDDRAAIQSAINAALATGGGIVNFPAGVYVCSGPLTAANAQGLTLRGVNTALDRIDTPRSEIRFAASGSASQVVAQSSSGFTIEGLAIRYSSLTYSGRLIDVTGGGTTYKPTLRNALISGMGGAVGSFCLIDLGNTVEATFEDVTFSRALHAVMGYDGVHAFQTALQWRGGRCVDLTSDAFLNPQEANTLWGVVFEPTASGAPSGILCDPTKPAIGLDLYGVEFWDSTTASGQWIKFAGSGLHIFGGKFQLSVGETAIVFDTTSAVVQGVSLTGLMVGGTGTFLGKTGVGSITMESGGHYFYNGAVDNSGVLAGFVPAPRQMAQAKKITLLSTAGTYQPVAGEVVHVDTTAGAVTIALPDVLANGTPVGGEIVIRKVAGIPALAANAVGTQRVDGAPGVGIGLGESRTLSSDGSGTPGGWRTVAASGSLAGGVVSAVNGTGVAHGLGALPTRVSLTTTNAAHIAAVAALDVTTITIGLQLAVGGSVTTAENVYWTASL